MSDIDYLSAQIIENLKLPPAEMLRKEVYRQTGLSEEEVDIKVDENGLHHAICRPIRKMKSVTMSVIIEQKVEEELTE